MGDRYRKYADKRALKMPIKIGSGLSGGMAGRKLREIITNITKTEHLDLLLSPLLALISYFKQKNGDCFSI